MADITFNGITMEFSVVEFMMDEQLKQDVASKLETYSEQSLLDAYIQTSVLSWLCPSDRLVR